MRIVVDGSVAAKWYFAEPGHEAADRVLAARIAGEHELLAPDLIVPEFVNVLWKRVRRQECSRAAAQLVLELWETDCPLVASSHLAAQASQLATVLDQSVYDCLYLALALSNEAPLVRQNGARARASSHIGAVS